MEKTTRNVIIVLSVVAAIGVTVFVFRDNIFGKKIHTGVTKESKQNTIKLTRG